MLKGEAGITMKIPVQTEEKKLPVTTGTTLQTLVNIPSGMIGTRMGTDMITTIGVRVTTITTRKGIMDAVMIIPGMKIIPTNTKPNITTMVMTGITVMITIATVIIMAIQGWFIIVTCLHSDISASTWMDSIITIAETTSIATTQVTVMPLPM
jgi:hypothetical protein